MNKLIGIFGGTFDPLHQGHRNSLNLLCEQFNFAQVHWVLSARPPHKNQTSASIEHRFEMLKLALVDESNFIADDIEITREERSYTFDTVQLFKERYPDATFCLIIGGDSMLNLQSWYRYQDLIDQVNLIVLHRPGYDVQVPDYLQAHEVPSLKQLVKYNAGKLALFEESAFDISSTQLRAVLQKDKKTAQEQQFINDALAPEVIDYIHQHKLYKQ